MSKFDEILNSSDASDALLGEQIDKINESIGNYEIISPEPSATGISIVSGGYTKIGKLVIVNVRFSFDSNRINAPIPITRSLPLPKVLSADKGYIAATVVDIQSDAPSASCYGCVSKSGELVAYVPTADHAYAISATYICE